MIAFFSLVSLRGVLVAPPKVTQVRVKKIFDRELAMLLRGPPSQFCHCGHFFVITNSNSRSALKFIFSLVYYTICILVTYARDRQTNILYF